MSTLEKIQLLEQKIIAGNFQLMNQVRSLPPKDQKEYSEKVSELIVRNQETVSKLIKS
jgi:hypothetical protein